MARAFNHRRRVERLEAKVPPVPVEEVRHLRAELRRLKKLEARLDRLLAAALGRMTPGEQEPVRRGLAQWNEGGDGPYAEWLKDLGEGRCRLPEMDPEALKGVLLAWLSPQRDWLARVCRRCGLEYPAHKSPPLSEWKVLPGKEPGKGEPPWYELPEFFRACPGCGASTRDITWPNLVDPADPPWKQASEGPGKGER